MESNEIKIMSKIEYDVLKKLWKNNFYRFKNGDFSWVCESCNDKWDSILLAHEPATEYLTLSYSDKIKSLEATETGIRDQFIGFKDE